MNEDEQAEMLTDLTQLILERISSAVEDVHRTLKTFPEINSVLSLIIDVSVCDTNVIQVISGSSRLVKPRIQDLQEKAK